MLSTNNVKVTRMDTVDVGIGSINNPEVKKLELSGRKRATALLVALLGRSNRHSGDDLERKWLSEGKDR